MSIDFELVLLSLVVGPTRTADQLEADEGISLLRRFRREYYFNLFNLSVNEEVLIELSLGYIFWQVSHPEFPNALSSAPSLLLLVARSLACGRLIIPIINNS